MQGLSPGPHSLQKVPKDSRAGSEGQGPTSQERLLCPGGWSLGSKLPQPAQNFHPP